jgi:threonylcarbamoyladenosine tRNA methylthiotransferase MtaB
MLKFKFKTLGCKVNQAESEALSALLKDAGLAPANHTAPADLYVINTCTVTQRAAMQSRQAIRQAIRANPNARVMVTGCYAQTAPEEIRCIDGVETILEHTDKPRLVEFVLNKSRAHDRTLRKTIQEIGPLDPSTVIGQGARSRPFLKVQDGCESFCTYCIVPYARGPSRSLPPDIVLESIEKICIAGFKEVVLTGIHLGNYGHDLSPSTDLLSLLRRIRKAGVIDRVRLSSIEPGEISETLIRFVADSSTGMGRICSHFHIPLQSGDDGILKRMHRPYSSRLFRELVLKINDLLPDAAIGVDIMVGFPGESVSAFERTCQIIEQLPISYMHVFPFSPRKGTPAYHFTDRVPDTIIRQRCRIIREIGNKKKSEFYRKFIGRKLEVIIEEKRHALRGYLKGTTANYIPVLIKECGALIQNSAPTNILIEKVDNELKVFGKASARCRDDHPPKILRSPTPDID